MVATGGEGVGEAWIDLKVRGDIEQMIRDAVDLAARAAASRPVPMPVRPVTSPAEQAKAAANPLNQPGSAAMPLRGNVPVRQGGMAAAAVSAPWQVPPAQAASGGASGASGWTAAAKWSKANQAAQGPLAGNPFANVLKSMKGVGTADIRAPSAINNPIGMAQAGASGGLGGVLSIVSQLGTFGTVVGIATTALTAMVATVFKFGAAASPNSWATMTSSWDLVIAKLGRLAVPAIEQLAKAAQWAAKWLDTIPRPGERRPQDENSTWRSAGWFAVSPDPTKWLRFAGGSKDVITRDDNREKSLAGLLAYARTGIRWDGSGREDMWAKDRAIAGMPMPQYSSFEEYKNRLDIAGLLSDTAEAKLAQEQLQNTKITAVNTGRMAEALDRFLQANPVAFRN